MKPMKTCRKCKILKHLTSFYRRTKTQTRAQCIECTRPTWNKNAYASKARYAPGGEYETKLNAIYKALGSTCTNCGWYERAELFLKWKLGHPRFINLSKRSELFKLEPKDYSDLVIRCNKPICAGRDKTKHLLEARNKGIIP